MKQQQWRIQTWEELPHAWNGDSREPIIIIGDDDGNRYGLYFPSLLQNMEIAFILGITAAIAVAVAAMLYILIVSKGKHDTTLAYLLGYGIFLPFWVLTPMYLIETLGITNTVFRFVIGTIPTVTFFRTLEVMYGYYPACATQSLPKFALYYASLFPVRVDEKGNDYVKATSSAIQTNFYLYLRGNILTGGLHSLYLAYPDIFIDFGVPLTALEKANRYSIATIFQWRTLWHNLCFAFFFKTYMQTCGYGLQLMTILITGRQLEEMWIDPLSGSISFSDFWSRRWNQAVHRTLKRGVFLPVRRYAPKYVAILATFLASGIFHEWLTWVSFHPLADSDCERISCFEPTYGPTTVFFLFQAILIALEFWLGKSTTRYTANIPRPIATLLVVCMGASMAHWFSEAYVHSRFFLDSRVAYILVKRVE